MKRQAVINQDVQAALAHPTKKGASRARTSAQRAKADKDSKRNRVTYDLPEELEAAVERIATDEGVSKSGAAAMLLAHAIHDYQERELGFEGLLVRSRSPLHEYKVDKDAVLGVMVGKYGLKRIEYTEG